MIVNRTLTRFLMLGLALELVGSPACFANLTNQQPVRQEGLMEQARACASKNGLNQSEHFYRAALSVQPDLIDARRELAQILSYQPQRRREAIQQFDLVLKKDPKDLPTRFARALTLAWLGSYDQSIAELKALISLRPDLVLAVSDRGREKLPIKLALAQVYTWSSNFSEALQYYSSYLSDSPMDTSARCEYAEVLSWLPDHWHDAIEQFNLVLRTDKTNTTVRFQKAMMLSNLHLFPDAVAELKALATASLTLPTIEQQGGESLPVGLALAQVLQYSGDFAASEDACKRFLLAKSDDPRALKCLGEVLSYQPSRRQEAIAIFRKLLDKAPADLSVRIDLINTLVWIGDKKSATQELFIVHSSGGKTKVDFDIEKELALDDLWAGNSEDALNEFQQAASHGGAPQDVEIIDGMAQCYVRLGRLEESESAYLNGLRCLPQSGRLHAGLAQVLILQDRAQEAVQQLELALSDKKDAAHLFDLLDNLAESSNANPLVEMLSKEILKSDPNNTRALLLLGQALTCAAATRTEGIDYLRHYVQLVPQDLKTKAYLAEVLSWGKNRKESLAMYQQLLDKEPSDYNLMADHAEVLSWSGKVGLAKREYKLVLSHQPDNRKALLGFARCLNWSGDYLQAEKYLQEANSRYPQDRELIIAEAINYRDMGRIDKAKKLLNE
jgi:tetratricopeptide (TPR) repeat protein